MHCGVAVDEPPRPYCCAPRPLMPKRVPLRATTAEGLVADFEAWALKASPHGRVRMRSAREKYSNPGECHRHRAYPGGQRAQTSVFQRTLADLSGRPTSQLLTARLSVRVRAPEPVLSFGLRGPLRGNFRIQIGLCGGSSNGAILAELRSDTANRTLELSNSTLLLRGPCLNGSGARMERAWRTGSWGGSGMQRGQATRPRPVKWCMRIRRHPRLVAGHDASASVGVPVSTVVVSRALVSDSWLM